MTNFLHFAGRVLNVFTALAIGYCIGFMIVKLITRA